METCDFLEKARAGDGSVNEAVEYGGPQAFGHRESLKKWEDGMSLEGYFSRQSR